ncbi:MAG: hypothetical protein IBX45_09420 [Campylobacterales bacterium]|nr:hypothetical protein [Campylobacterales bacterium]
MLEKMRETSFGPLAGTLCVLMLILLILYGTGFGFHQEEVSSWNLMLHHMAAVGLLVLIGVHTWLNACKMRKMRDEFRAMLKGQDIKHHDNRGFLIEQLKQKSLREMCALFNMDGARLQESLRVRHIYVKDLDENFKAIAKANQKDMYELWILILREHVEHASS